jgi:hypothetical protein
MIDRKYRYRLVEVITHDYGDGPAAGVYAEGLLSIIHDGSFWRDRPATLKIGVEAGRRPGAEFEVSIREVGEGERGKSSRP